MNRPIGLVNTPPAGMRFVDRNGFLTVAARQFLDALLAAVQGSEPYTVTNAAESRTFDAPTVTLPELADVVGTLISDLESKEILS